MCRPTCEFIRLFKGKDWGVMVGALKAKDYTNVLCQADSALRALECNININKVAAKFKKTLQRSMYMNPYNKFL